VAHSFWLKRPLPEEYLRYAVRDVYFMGLLYNHFKEEGYITSQLSEQSDRYVGIWQDAKPKKTDEYRSHALLPLQILDYRYGYGPVRSCIGCQRNLPHTAYSNTAWGGLKRRRCWACRAIYLKIKANNAPSYDDDDVPGLWYGPGDYEGYVSDDDYYGGGGYSS